MNCNDIYGEDHTLNHSQRERFNCAVEYIERGYPILLTKGKHPLQGTRGVNDATTDIEQFAQAFKRNPTRNIAAATGHEFWVVDADINPDEGIDGLESLLNKFGKDFVIDPETHMYQTTPSGGMHFFIELPDDGLPVPSPVGVLDGVDIRGLGTYIVISPSGLMINDKWKQYRLRNGEDENFLPCEGWTKKLLDMAREQKPSSSKGLLNDAITNGIGQGQRDESIFKLACMCRRDGIDQQTTYHHLCAVADKCKPPFSHDEVQKKIDSAWSYQNQYSQEIMEAIKKKADMKISNINGNVNER